MLRSLFRGNFTARGSATLVVVVTISAMAALSPPAHGSPITDSSSSRPSPVTQGPITGGVHGTPFFTAPFDVGQYGYTEQEYFYSGTARAYGASLPPAPYTTRMLVYRPTDPAKFSGNVVVEWNNVTSQLDAPVDFMWLQPQVMAEGDAYVQVTAQQVGVCGSGPTCTPTSIKGIDPQRYQPLTHPGDEYAADIFSQAGLAVRYPNGASPLGDLAVERVIAAGESQSATQLDKYISLGADADTRVFDAFLIDADVHYPTPVSYRVPTLHIWSEDSAQPTATTFGPNHVIWSVAGAAHTDRGVIQKIGSVLNSLTPIQPKTRQQEEAEQLANGNYGQEGGASAALSSSCIGNSQFPRRYVLDAALNALEAWVEFGIPAPTAPPFQFTGATSPLAQIPGFDDLAGATDGQDAGALFTQSSALVRDGDGNAVGGLRLPVITVPVATYNGTTCVLFGTTTSFTKERLRQLYPTHDDYVTQMEAAVQQAIDDRYLTPRDGEDLLMRARASTIPD